eukprot:12077667-Alexandrium_andersonii.AAC.1
MSRVAGQVRCAYSQLADNPSCTCQRCTKRMSWPGTLVADAGQAFEMLKPQVLMWCARRLFAKAKRAG